MKAKHCLNCSFMQFSNVNKHLINSHSDATIVTAIEVDVDELWTRTVTKTPIISPTIGFFSRSLFDITLPAALPPIRRNDDERKSNEQIKK